MFGPSAPAPSRYPLRHLEPVPVRRRHSRLGHGATHQGWALTWMIERRGAVCKHWGWPPTCAFPTRNPHQHLKALVEDVPLKPIAGRITGQTFPVGWRDQDHTGLAPSAQGQCPGHLLDELEQCPRAPQGGRPRRVPGWRRCGSVVSDDDMPALATNLSQDPPAYETDEPFHVLTTGYTYPPKIPK